MAPNIIRMERQRLRLTKFHDLVSQSPYFDQEDEKLVHAELQRTKSTLRELVKSLKPEEKTRLDMFRTLALREELVENAVRNDVLNPEEDGVFTLLVKKQVELTRIVNGR